MARASATKSSAKKSSSGTRATRSKKKQDAAILSAHRTLTRTERREARLAKTLKDHAKAIKATEKQSVALRRTLAAATKDLRSAVTSRKRVARQLRKLEAGRSPASK